MNQQQREARENALMAPLYKCQHDVWAALSAAYDLGAMNERRRVEAWLAPRCPDHEHPGECPWAAAVRDIADGDHWGEP